MIIVEGMDNSGKSTLIQQLMARLPELHLIGSEGPKDRDTMLLRCIKGMVDPCSIYDRYHLFSEFVYGPVIRQECKFAGVWAELAYLTLLNLPVVIYCRPDDETICLFDQRDQMGGVKKNAKELIGRYDMVMEHFRNLTLMYSMGAVIRYDYREMDIEPVVEFIKQYLTASGHLSRRLRELAYRDMNNEQHNI